MWAGIESTCRNCRTEWLINRMKENPRDWEALGGKDFTNDDYKTRTTVENFLDLAEGSIDEVLLTGRERDWLRRYTKFGDMLSQAILATKYDDRSLSASPSFRGFERQLSPALSMSFSDLSDVSPTHSPAQALDAKVLELQEMEKELEMEMSQDVEFLSIIENDGVRGLALNDWARKRILDGCWVSPADSFYGFWRPPRDLLSPESVHLVNAVHPVPWSLDAEATRDHPSAAQIFTSTPPTYALCEQTFHAHRRMLTSLLLPTMKNLVRKVVIEAGVDGVDPIPRIGKMDILRDVVGELRNEGIWWEGVDWVERRRNGERREETTPTTESTSTASSGASPVLSTTTLGTTPSPPPASEEEMNKAKSPLTSPPPPPLSSLPLLLSIPVAPPLNPPRLLPSIPYIPTATNTSLGGHYTLEALRAVWREATALLFHCCCRICERAKVAATLVATNNNTNSGSTATAAANPNDEKTSLGGSRITTGGGEVVIRPERVQSPDVVEIKLGSPSIEAKEEEEEEELEGGYISVSDSSLSISAISLEEEEEEEIVYERRVGSRSQSMRAQSVLRLMRSRSVSPEIPYTGNRLPPPMSSSLSSTTATPSPSKNARKRSVDEILDENGGNKREGKLVIRISPRTSSTSLPVATPSKRARTEQSPTRSLPSLGVLPPGLARRISGEAKRRVSDGLKTRKRGDPTSAAVGGRKRSSEELDDDSVVSITTGGDEIQVWTGIGKRMRRSPPAG